jgi:hypothetical protein
MPLKKTPIIVILVLLFSVMLVNLAFIPIAWVDEVMLIDPAWNLFHLGKFVGSTWPHAGTENVFLAYLPLSSFIHAISLQLFPADIFWMRLPWFIMLIGTSLFLHYYCVQRYMSLPAGVLLLVCFFVMDEGISNALRSVRVEMISMLLTSAALFLSYRGKFPTIQSFIISLLLISHPNVVPIAVVLSIYLLTRKATTLKKMRYMGTILLFPLLYLVIAKFDLQAIYEQLILHGKEHDATALSGNLFYNHFIARFLPMYNWQWYIPVLFLIMHVYAVYSIFFRWNPGHQQVEWAFLSCSIFWFFTLAPFNRYTAVMTLLIFMMLPGLMHRGLSVLGFLRLSFRKISWYHAISIFAILIYISIPFLTRNAVAMSQRSERKAASVYPWLDKNIENKNPDKVLIVDEAIGFYYMMKHPDEVAFTLPYALPKYRFEDYEKVYYLSFRAAPKNAKEISKLVLPSKELPFAMPRKIITYNGLCLYEITSAEGLQEITR